MDLDALIPKLVVLFMIVMFAGFSVVALQKRQRDKQRIRDYLMEKGYRQIEIAYEWFDFDRSNSTYRVTCRTGTGERVMTSCKIHRAQGWDDDIYWRNPL